MRLVFCFVNTKVFALYIIGGGRKGLLTWVITTLDEWLVVHLTLQFLTYRPCMRGETFNPAVCIFKEDGRNVLYQFLC